MNRGRLLAIAGRSAAVGLLSVTLRAQADAVATFDVSSVKPNTLAAAPETAPSIFTALREQLGLKLEPARDEVRVLIVDHIERPRPD